MQVMNGELMDRRSFLKLGALAGSSVLAADWLFSSELAHADGATKNIEIRT
mgnify:FL=1